jgi:predicted nucleotidyltransferase
MTKTIPLDRLVSRRAAKHLLQFRQDVERSLVGRVREVVLFGSRARGDAKKASDYDVAVVLKDEGDRQQINCALSDLAYPHILSGIHIRPVPIPASYIDGSEPRAISRAIERDGVVIR